MPANWPAIAHPTFSTRVGVTLPALRSTSEAGYTIVRRGLALAKDKRSLTWAAMSDADFATLRTFFIANQGGSFYWSNPKTADADFGVVREYFFADDELSFTEVEAGIKAGTVNIEEI